MNKNFLNMLIGLNSPNKMEAVKLIMSKCKEQVAIDDKFYENEAKTKICSEDLFGKLNTSDIYLELLIKIETSSPYSIFTYIIDKENFSDIMFHKLGYNLSDNMTNEIVTIPNELMNIYTIFMDHFIENVVFIASKKFDVANADLDIEVNKLRFNLTHKSLTKNGGNIISIRKQTIKKHAHTSDKYLKSTNASENQINIIHKYSQKGNFIIFGETGSGKTTLLDYMGNYMLEEKRNLCIIEDTAELNIEVPISLITNNKYKIKDLFTKALRQNPSSIFVGETRTDEIIDILESALTINVGTTIHANSFERVIQRIIFMSMIRKIDPQQIKDLINASVDCFIFMGNRQIKEIWENKPGVQANIYEAYQQVV